MPNFFVLLLLPTNILKIKWKLKRKMSKVFINIAKYHHLSLIESDILSYLKIFKVNCHLKPLSKLKTVVFKILFWFKKLDTTLRNVRKVKRSRHKFRNWAFEFIQGLKLDSDTYMIVEIVRIVWVWGFNFYHKSLISIIFISLRVQFNICWRSNFYIFS